ncbi:hypothetical protein [Terricaulis sp.]|uniref:hypothetical protein n=1 Tax=Terricaulis sp. TaxID=2768686 RepID=UPI003784ED5D
MADGAGPRFDIAGLDILYQRLANAGFKVGPAGQSRANLLLLEFISRDALPDDPEDLARWLQPIFVTRSEDRARFFETVMAWSRSARHVEVAPEEEKEAPKKLLPKREFDGRPATPPPEIKPPFWRRVPRAAWVGLAALVVLGAGALTPQVQNAVVHIWAQLTAPNADTTTATTETSTATSMDTSTTATIASPPEVHSRQQTDASIEALIASIDARVDVYDGMPTLRELYAATPAASGEQVISLPDDPDTVAARMGFSADRPLPLTRTAVMRRLLTAMQPDAPVAFARADRASRIDDLATGGGAQAVSLAGHADAIWSVAFSSDGTRIVTASSDGTARVWDSETGREIIVLRGHADEVFGARFSADGTLIVTASRDRTVRIWDTQSGRLTAPPLTHESRVNTAEFSPDGASVVTASTDGTVRLWDVATGQLRTAFIGHTSEVYTASFNSDGTRVASASQDGTVKIWSATTGLLVASLRANDAAVYSASFSPDGRRIVTASQDRTARIWDAERAVQIIALVGHDDEVYGAAFSPNGARVMTASADGTARVWDATTGRQIARFTGSPAGFTAGAYSPDGTHIVIVSRDGTARLRAAPVRVGENVADIMQEHSLTKAQLGERVRAALGMQPYPEVDAEAEAQLNPADREALIQQRAESASDDDIARAWALLSFDTGWPLNISDPPWLRPDQQRAADPLRPYKDNANWIAAGIVAFVALALWLWSAINARGFLARRRPDDSGRVADLAADDRSKAERADQSLRIAARRLLERRESTRALDLTASVDATARAGGFFTPVSRAHRRIPEYLFLIDSRSRFDHDAKRALDYVERLRAENVKADFYFFERAPDRVREDIGRPLVPLETITSQHATRRLVVVGDAAAMLESDGKTVGRWADTVKVWEDRALMTTVPVSEWGEEENRLAGALGMLVRPLSANALAQLPAEMRNETDVQRQVAGAAGLGERPLPAMLREAPHIWTLESPPAPADIDRMLAELHAFLGQHGFRWLSACAVYPAIEWDLTMALGWRLKEGEAGEERPLVNEQRTALISELPWMRTGAMPQWLRERLLDEMSPHDRQAVRAFLGELLDTARNSARAPRDTITLSFSVEGGRGRDMFDDDVFVQFLLEDPKGRDTRALEATRKVRELLLPPLAARLLRPAELAVLLSGLMLAAAAWWIAPRFTDAPLPTGAWAPLAALALVPLLLWVFRGAIGGLFGGAWRTLRDPRGAWDDWRERTEAQKVVRDTDRLAYLQSIAPRVLDRSAFFRAVFTAGAAVFAICLPLGFLLRAGLIDLAPLRTSLGEAGFGWAALVAVLAVGGLLLAVAWLARRIGLTSANGSLPTMRAHARPSGYAVLTLCTLLVIEVLAASCALLAPAPLWAYFATGAVLSVIFVQLLVERRAEQRLSRLELGLQEQPPFTTEAYVNAPRSVAANLTRALRRKGIRAAYAVQAASPDRVSVSANSEGENPGVTSPSARFEEWRSDLDFPAFTALLRDTAAMIKNGERVASERIARPYAVVSFATADTERLTPVVLALAQSNIPVWVDVPAAFLPFSDEIQACIDNGTLFGTVDAESGFARSSAFLSVASKAAIKSDASSAAVGAATQRWRDTGQRYFIAPIFLSPDDAGQMQDDVDSFQGFATHTTNESGRWTLTAEGSEAIDELIEALRNAFHEFDLNPLPESPPMRRGNGFGWSATVRK